MADLTNKIDLATPQQRGLLFNELNAATHNKRGLRIPDIVASTGFCRSKIYEAIAAGHLKARKYGRATVVLAEDLDAFLRSLPTVQPRAA